MIVLKDEETKSTTVYPDKDANSVIENLAQCNEEITDGIKEVYREHTKKILKELLYEIYNSEYKELISDFVNEVEQINSVNNNLKEASKHTDLDSQISLLF